MRTMTRAVWMSLILVPLVFGSGRRLTTETNPAISPGPAQRQEPSGRIDTSASNQREFIDSNCVACHNEQLLTSGLTLDGIDVERVGANAEVWEKVLHKVGTGQMPPMGMPRPDEAAANAILSWLETELDLAAVANPEPGSVGVHRLNQTEYANAVRDLLGLEVDGNSLLLPDEADSGFDNIASNLPLSPTHLERYMSAARKISRLAVGDLTMGIVPGFKQYAVSEVLDQDVRVSEDLPFGSRGGAAVRHHFPLDGEYVIRVRLRRQAYDYIMGMGSAQNIDVRIDGRRVHRFTVGGEAPGLPGPLTWTGAIVGDLDWEQYMHEADAGLDVRVAVQAGTRTVGVSFVDTPWEDEGFLQPRYGMRTFGRHFDELYDDNAAVARVDIGGPYFPGGPGDTPSRRAVFLCRPTSVQEENPCARTILSRLARRAYRRPVTEDEVQTLLGFYRTGRGKGDFDTGIQKAIERLLVSFNFIFRIERDPQDVAPGTVYQISQLELASRLSFFLWSSIPDEELLGVATRGELRNDGVLEHQVRRMLDDPRSRALVDNFANQWLTVRRVHAWQPDPARFDFFDENLRHAFLEETELFLDSQLGEDRSVVELLSADYTFVNERLARHYEIPGVYGERFRRVTLNGTERGGLLGQGSILMVTSYPDRTSPVVRGVWLLENILGMPPPPPPPTVPALEPRSEDGRARSMREQMELHRRNPACAVCHVRIDPVGFALENFDAVGRWRVEADGLPIDASSVFADGTAIEGVAGLRRFLLRNQESFVRTFTEKLLTYALGRTIEYYDHAAIREIQRKSADTDYRWSSIILGIVESTPFQMRRTAS